MPTRLKDFATAVVAVVEPETSAFVAAQLMRKHHVGALAHFQRADRLTARSDDGAADRGPRGFPAGNTDITPLPHGIRAIAILDRGLLARLILGPDIAAIDRKAAIPIQRNEDTCTSDVGLIVDQRPLL